MLRLETVGEIEELLEGEVIPPQPPQVSLTQSLRASHHLVARLDAKGVPAHDIARQTGYTANRIGTLRACPSYRDLVHHYRQDNDTVAEAIEAKFQLIAEDAAQVIHERILDKPQDMSLDEAVNVFKTFADRAGFAPVQRTVNKNMNLNIGARLDAARARKITAE